MTVLLLVLKALQALAPAIALALIGVWGGRQKAQGEQQGVAQAATAAAQVTAQAETAIAVAEVEAPSTPQAVVDRLKAGTF